MSTWPFKYLIPEAKFTFYQDIAMHKLQRVMFMKGRNIALSSFVELGEEACYFSEDIASEK